MCVYIFLYIYICVCVCVCIYMYVYIYIYIYIYVYIYMYVYTYKYTYTHTHTHIYTYIIYVEAHTYMTLHWNPSPLARAPTQTQISTRARLTKQALVQHKTARETRRRALGYLTPSCSAVCCSVLQCVAERWATSHPLVAESNYTMHRYNCQVSLVTATYTDRVLFQKQPDIDIWVD